MLDVQHLPVLSLASLKLGKYKNSRLWTSTRMLSRSLRSPLSTSTLPSRLIRDQRARVEQPSLPQLVTGTIVKSGTSQRLPQCCTIRNSLSRLFRDCFHETGPSPSRQIPSFRLNCLIRWLSAHKLLSPLSKKTSDRDPKPASTTLQCVMLVLLLPPNVVSPDSWFRSYLSEPRGTSSRISRAPSARLTMLRCLEPARRGGFVSTDDKTLTRHGVSDDDPYLELLCVMALLT